MAEPIAPVGSSIPNFAFFIRNFLMLRLLLCLSLPLYLLDQWSKHWIVAHYPLNGPEDTIIPGVFWMHHTANVGVAFGLGNGQSWANYVFGAVSIGAAILISVLVRKGAFPGAFSRTAAALLYAGIAGNLTDRLWLYQPTNFRGDIVTGGFTERFFHGYVVDFLKFDLKFMIWPSFNVADSCVVSAAILLVAASFFEKPAAKSIAV